MLNTVKMVVWSVSYAIPYGVLSPKKNPRSAPVECLNNGISNKFFELISYSLGNFTHSLAGSQSPK